MSAEWERLIKIAGEVVGRVITSLPDELREEAQKVPVLYEEECEEDPDILGRYGHFVAGEVSTANGPIILYLLTISDFCEGEHADFVEEVRTTYLHELGHHLGLDEGDLEERGLL